jgi:pyruvate dehydrogenase E2 component (dihydrolipoyllysine-residue acetyltransferase)
MPRLNLVVRGLAPAAAAVCAVGFLSTAAWANPPAPHPAPPAPHPAPAPQAPHPAPAPPAIHDADCTRGNGHPVPDPHNPRIRHCVGGQFNGRNLS